MTLACESCLRRGALVGHLGGRIAAMLDDPAHRVGGLLALPDGKFAEALRAESNAAEFQARFQPEAMRDRLRAARMEAVCRHASEYPAGLLALEDAPAVLFVADSVGRLQALMSRSVVAIVGARRASTYGIEMARSLGRGLSAAGVTVVSGLALGIDGAAHEGALEGGDGLALAVLASGADVPYPARHRMLHRRVRERGAVVSELPPGRRAFRWSFPARNRIMAALAEMTIVVEAADPSGSLITATFAEQLGREVGAVPGRTTARLAAGTNRLLREGASVIRSGEDVLDELFGVGLGPDGPRRPPPPIRLSASLRAVLDGVEENEPVELIGRRAELSAAEVRASLGRLEGLGLVFRTGVGGYERAQPG